MRFASIFITNHIWIDSYEKECASASARFDKRMNTKGLIEFGITEGVENGDPATLDVVSDLGIRGVLQLHEKFLVMGNGVSLDIAAIHGKDSHVGYEIEVQVGKVEFVPLTKGANGGGFEFVFGVDGFIFFVCGTPFVEKKGVKL